MTAAAHSNFDQAELDKFAELAHRWWGEMPRSRGSSGLSCGNERPATDGRAGAMHHGRFGTGFEGLQ
ncbi:MAG: hypothetical protein JSR26_13090 [Proteobacteria bacterium]|nr:hypothetical protein [Pseudomonadota bacterium]